MKSSVWARSRTSGPTTIPSISSSTTTGGAKRRGTTATVIAAIAATRTIAKKDSVSTSIKAEPILWARPGRIVEWTVLGGESAVPCNPQSALAGPKTVLRGWPSGSVRRKRR